MQCNVRLHVRVKFTNSDRFNFHYQDVPNHRVALSPSKLRWTLLRSIKSQRLISLETQGDMKRRAVSSNFNSDVEIKIGRISSKQNFFRCKLSSTWSLRKIDTGSSKGTRANKRLEFHTIWRHKFVRQLVLHHPRKPLSLWRHKCTLKIDFHHPRRRRTCRSRIM